MRGEFDPAQTGGGLKRQTYLSRSISSVFNLEWFMALKIFFVLFLDFFFFLGGHASEFYLASRFIGPLTPFGRIMWCHQKFQKKVASTFLKWVLLIV